MTAHIDLHALRLLAGEIDLGLEAVSATLSTLDDTAQVRCCERELHRMRGAFGMVGAPGLARFAEALSAALLAAAGSSEHRSQWAVRVERALDELRRCLKDTYRSGVLQSLNLFSSYVELKRMVGDDKVNASDLFYPTLQVARDMADAPLLESDGSTVARHTRAGYQRAMLAWLQGDQYAIGEMVRAVRTLDHVFSRDTHFWWIAGGFLDAISQRGIVVDSHIKRICARIDLQISRVAQGGQEISEALLREMLFHIGQSAAETPRVSELRQAFGLAPATVSRELFADTFSTREIILSLVRDVQQRYSALVSEPGGDWQSFHAAVERLVMCSEGFKQHIVQVAVETVRDTARALVTAKVDELDTDSVNLAHVLLALEELLSDDGQDAIATAKLAALLSGESGAAAANHSLNMPDDVAGRRRTDPSLLREMHQCLRQIEAAVESAQQLGGKQSAAPMAKPLRQVIAALQMDGHGDAEKILRHAERLINVALSAGDWQAHILDIADCLGALDLFVEALHTDHQQAGEVLVPTLRKLGIGAANDSQGNDQQTTQSVATVEQAIENERLGVETLVHNWQQTTAHVVSEIKTNLEAIHHDALIVADRQMSERSAHALTLLQSASSDFDPQLRRVAEAVGARPSEAGGGVAECVDVASDVEILEVFLEEVLTLTTSLNAALEQCRRAASTDALREVRRAFHTLKGSSGVAGLGHMSKVAWAVERQLNAWLDRNKAASTPLLNALAEVSAAFVIWRENLAQCATTAVDVQAFTRRFAQLTPDATGDATASVGELPVAAEPANREPDVSNTLFAIFVSEASQRIETLRSDLATSKFDEPPRPSSVRAAHTLAGIARTVHIETIATLAAAGEHWLGRLRDSGNPLGVPGRVLLSEFIDALAVMYAAVETHSQPLAHPALCRRLAVAAAQSSTAPTGSALSAQAASGSTALEAALLRDVGEDILPTFIDEAHELGTALAQQLLAWREAPDDNRYPEAVARYLHTLKGSARAAGAVALGDFAHATEARVQATLVGEAYDGDWVRATLEWVDQWLGCIDSLRATAGGNTFAESTAPREDDAPAAASGQLRVSSALVERLLEAAGEMGVVRSRVATEIKAVSHGVVDLKDSIGRLRQQLREIEIQAESQMSARLTLLDEANDAFDPLEFDRFTRLQELTRLMAESLHDITAVQQNLLRGLDEAEIALERQDLLTRGMHSDLMHVYAVPFDNISERLHRVVRQTALSLGKQAQLRIHGAQIELDRSMLDRVIAPFEHLLRNAVAHGIEQTEDRERAGKDETGYIDIFLHQEANRIRIEVDDDGAGLDLKRIRRTAEQCGLVDSDAKIDDAALGRLIFTPGLSTADTVTEIAGRGIGMDAVRSALASVGGDIDVSSVRGRGTRFTMHLPLTVVVVSVLSVAAAGRAIAVPSTLVRQVQRMTGPQLRALYELKHAEWQGESYPFHYLGQLLGEASSPPIAERSNFVIMLSDGTRRAAIHVDSLAVNQEVTLKDMGPQLGRIQALSGAAVTGGGRVLLVVDPLALQTRVTLRQAGATTVNAVNEERPLVLVIDDSITVRKVTSRLMERAGYRVAVAKDGLEGLEVLQRVIPAVVLLDIEMPRMDGFEFTKHLRASADTCDVPIIMISSRTAEKHRVHAEQLGVNLFLGKPFQDEQLLDAIADYTNGAVLARTGT